MRAKKRRHLSPAGFICALILIIAAIFIVDALIRLFMQTDTENIVGTDGFSLTASTSDGDTPDTTEGGNTAAEDSVTDATVLQLTTADQANGTLVLIDTSHPYTGNQDFSSFANINDAYVKPRDVSLPLQAEALDPLCTLFDAYASSNGSANLQIDSTTDSTLSLYSNTLPDRSCGYAFDIGLITSTGEVVQYLKKQNEWMVSNSWQYGFVVRYPNDKTEATGIAFSPHHFRYVGKVHAAIMHENNFCLEEYLNYLQSYTIDSGGLSYSDGTQTYTIYYVPTDASGTTTVQLPKDISYTVSGDNRGGFIITTVSSAAVTTAPDTSGDQTTTSAIQ